MDISSGNVMEISIKQVETHVKKISRKFLLNGILEDK